MIGNSTTTEQRYLRNHNNENIYDDQSKEVIFRNYWSKIFTITLEDKAEFDLQTDETVNEYLENNKNQLATLPETDMTKLLHSVQVVTFPELKKIINSFKQKAPGEDEITK